MTTPNNLPNGGHHQRPHPPPDPRRQRHYLGTPIATPFSSSSSTASFKGCCCCLFLLLTFLALLAVAVTLVIVLVLKLKKPYGMIGSWLPPNPSSRTLLSSSSTKDFVSRSLPAFLVENGNLGLSWNPGNQTVGVSSKTEGERMATRKGFNVPKLDTANIPSTSTISSLEIPLPYLTIPSGLSPTALFESPALFSDISDQPPPAIGKLEFLEYLSSNTMHASCSAAFAKSEYNIFEDISEALTFKTPLESDSHHSRLVRKIHSGRCFVPVSSRQSFLISISSRTSKLDLWKTRAETTWVEANNVKAKVEAMRSVAVVVMFEAKEAKTVEESSQENFLEMMEALLRLEEEQESLSASLTM
ncbi:hypothetical protein ZIOFF_024513 [Zingiber officinale]|uniref:Uncharacterized protein n=1 Tax=Zingiber officinale TaxID=94328 RepID=A0A8J5LG83_ZINOF|nr:hypothetical protein ZIOFF_024513 [Zingiber officinale]